MGLNLCCRRGPHVAKWLHHPSVSALALHAGMQLAMATYHMLSWQPTCGQNGYITLAAMGVPNTPRGEKVKNTNPTLAIL